MQLSRETKLGLVALFAAILLPVFGLMSESIGSQVSVLFIFALLALGLNVVVGYTGMLHLGIAAFFAAGAYIGGIVTVASNPFQVNFFVALGLAAIGSALLGVLLGAPTLRLRGDYLALVTLGFGEVVRYAITNLPEITAGTTGITPVPPPKLPGPLADPEVWSDDYRPFYYLTLAVLAIVVIVLRQLERSSYGRAWIALREDELAATCMGINAPRAKLSAFAIGSAIAGIAGCLYATKLTTTSGPSAYEFSRSITILACVILGGLGSIRGTLLGVALIIGFDFILAPMLDEWLQAALPAARDKDYLTFRGWRYAIFGLALILMMRFRPEGLLPSQHIKEELHANVAPTTTTGAK